jgi:hypothetical protein
MSTEIFTHVKPIGDDKKNIPYALRSVRSWVCKYLELTGSIKENSYFSDYSNRKEDGFFHN